MNNNELNIAIADMHSQLLKIINETLIPLPIKKIIVENIYLTVSAALNKSLEEENENN